MARPDERLSLGKELYPLPGKAARDTCEAFVERECLKRITNVDLADVLDRLTAILE